MDMSSTVCVRWVGVQALECHGGNRGADACQRAKCNSAAQRLQVCWLWVLSAWLDQLHDA